MYKVPCTNAQPTITDRSASIHRRTLLNSMLLRKNLLLLMIWRLTPYTLLFLTSFIPIFPLLQIPFPNLRTLSLREVAQERARTTTTISLLSHFLSKKSSVKNHCNKRNKRKSLGSQWVLLIYNSLKSLKS